MLIQELWCGFKVFGIFRKISWFIQKPKTTFDSILSNEGAFCCWSSFLSWKRKNRFLMDVWFGALPIYDFELLLNIKDELVRWRLYVAEGNHSWSGLWIVAPLPYVHWDEVELPKCLIAAYGLGVFLIFNASGDAENCNIWRALMKTWSIMVMPFLTIIRPWITSLISSTGTFIVLVAKHFSWTVSFVFLYFFSVDSTQCYPI